MALTFTPGAGVVYMRDGAREITLLPQQVEQLLDIWEAADAHPWFNDLYEAGQRADAAPTATPYSPAADLNREIDRIVGERDARKHRIAIRNVERRIGSLRFPAGLHVTHLIDAKARLEQSLSALEGAASAKAA